MQESMENTADEVTTSPKNHYVAQHPTLKTWPLKSTNVLSEVHRCAWMQLCIIGV